MLCLQNVQPCPLFTLTLGKAMTYLRICTDDLLRPPPGTMPFLAVYIMFVFPSKCYSFSKNTSITLFIFCQGKHKISEKKVK